MPDLPAFQLEPQYRAYIWGGQRLRPPERTAEMWAVFGGDLITTGPLAGLTLDQAAELHGADLLGRHVVRWFGQREPRFPLLIKLLDCAEWLSLQVHPNDEQAVFLAGPDHYGKNEAWHILESDPGAEILCGFRPESDRETILQAVLDGTIMLHVRRLPMQAGDTVFMRAGTLHALGPGLLVYEVQQSSDITYRVYDWDRPASAGRELHLAEALAVLNTEGEAPAIPPPPYSDGALELLVSCPYFTLRLLTTAGVPVALDPNGETFHALTCIEGRVAIEGAQWSLPLDRYESAVIPASAGPYRVAAVAGQARALVASIE